MLEGRTFASLCAAILARIFWNGLSTGAIPPPTASSRDHLVDTKTPPQQFDTSQGPQVRVRVNIYYRAAQG